MHAQTRHIGDCILPCQCVMHMTAGPRALTSCHCVFHNASTLALRGSHKLHCWEQGIVCVCVCVCVFSFTSCLPVLFVTRALAVIALLANRSYIAAPAASRHPPSCTVFDEWTINVHNIPAPPLLTLILFKILRWTATLFKLESFPCAVLNDLLKLAFLVGSK